jgi:Fanconi anemia group M protein
MYKKLEKSSASQMKPIVPPKTEDDAILEDTAALINDDYDYDIDAVFEQSKTIAKGFYEDDTMPKCERKAAQTWYYPSNMAVRTYQKTIVESALFKNTLVCLPTGLGKTLIASVLMYNYFRWFPKGKIIFVAPTTTLVAQQITACYNIMGIPESDTVALTGKVDPAKRKAIWNKKRVFFCTPHVVVSDLEDGKCPGREVVLVVVDEAHRATKNYFYCSMIRLLSQMTNHYRVLALSATPGSELPAIQDVVTNLQIAHVEVRDEHDPDVRQYLQQKVVSVRTVKLTGELNELQDYIYLLMKEPIDKLFAQRAIFKNDPRTISKGYLFVMRRDHLNGKFHLSADFTVASELCQLNEKLTSCGLQDFSVALEKYYNDAYLGKTKSNTKAKVIKNPNFEALLRRTREMMKSGQVHPKLLELEKVVLNHFNQNRVNGTLRETRVIIFASLRETVQNIVERLSKHSGTLKVMKFVGQSSAKTKGLANKDQKRVIEEFIRGNYNTLVSTSVGEEGLDIGEVDLIVCYDAVASPTRMIQRMGRTGRKRKGEAMIIVAEGEEEKKYFQSQKRIADLFKAMKNVASENSGCQFYAANNRMIPDTINPRLEMIQVNVNPLENNFSSPRGNRRKRENELISIAEEDYLQKTYGIGIPDEVDNDDYWKPLVEKIHKDRNWRDYQSMSTPYHQIRHSVASILLTKLFRFIDDEEHEDLEINWEPNFPFIDQEELEEIDRQVERRETIDVDEPITMIDDDIPDIPLEIDDWDMPDDNSPLVGGVDVFDEPRVTSPSDPWDDVSEVVAPVSQDFMVTSPVHDPVIEILPDDSIISVENSTNGGYKRARVEHPESNKRARVIEKSSPASLRETTSEGTSTRRRLNLVEIEPVSDELMKECTKCKRIIFSTELHSSICFPEVVSPRKQVLPRQLARQHRNNVSKLISRQLLPNTRIYANFIAAQDEDPDFMLEIEKD